MVPTVTKDEGLHSPRAIAFIFNRCSREAKKLRSITYNTLRTTLRKVTNFLKITKQAENRLSVTPHKNLGDI